MNRQPSLMRLLRRLDRSIASLFFLDQWVILTAKGLGPASLRWSALHPIIPPADRYWADPFPILRENRYYVFAEEKLHSTQRGRIICLVLDTEGRLLSGQVVLERPYHLSYPFIFDYRGETYMLPESASNRTLEVYRCRHFPDQWELEKVLMSEVYAVDATLLELNDRWWMFANVKQEDGTSLDALHLFHAASPLSSAWTPHPRNPLVKDLKTARPAGRIFAIGDELIRPSQNNYYRYGYGLNFMRVTTLNESAYAESAGAVFEPPPWSKYRAAHTFNQAGGLTVVDAVLRRWKFGA